MAMATRHDLDIGCRGRQWQCRQGRTGGRRRPMPGHRRGVPNPRWTRPPGPSAPGRRPCRPRFLLPPVVPKRAEPSERWLSSCLSLVPVTGAGRAPPPARLHGRVGGPGLSFREPNRPRKPTPRRRPEACQVCPDRNAVFSDCAPIPGATDHSVSGREGRRARASPAIPRRNVRPAARQSATPSNPSRSWPARVSHHHHGAEIR